MAMESLYEYGSRAGFWRLHRLFTERGVPVTVFGVAAAMDEPAAVEAMLKADWEVASHGFRWIDYQYLPEKVEREHIARPSPSTLADRQPPAGLVSGRTSPNTARLVAQRAASLRCRFLCRRCALLG
jgi:peptidoglycan/xylan/chitin deacetylase (PgdA/CDA1 family)